jgi:hypothetical protein
MIFKLSLLLVLDAHKVGASALTGSKGVSEEDKMLLDCLECVSYAEDDKMLLDCLECVSYAKVSIWSFVLD